MTKYFFFLLLLLLSTLPPLDAQDNTAAWEENLDVLITELPQNHINPFTQISQDEWLAAAESLRAELPTLTDQEILMRTAALVVSLGDSHTVLVWEISEMVFPMQLRVFEDGIYPLASYPEAAPALASRLVSINDMPIETVLEKISTVIAHENEAWLNAQLPNFLVQTDVLLGLGIIENTEPVAWTFENSAGETITVNVTPIDRSTLDGSLFQFLRPSTPRTEQTNGNYWLELFEDGTLYMKYNTATEAPDLPMNRFIDILLTALDEQPVERLVIDLRDNTGGNSSLLDPLITALTEHPINTDGKLFVIIGNRTYSSALLNAVRLSQKTEAVLVGQPTGGSPNHFGEVRSFDLPHFDLTVTYSTNYFETMPDLEDHTLMPDVLVPLTIEDYANGVDAFYQAVMAYQQQ